MMIWFDTYIHVFSIQRSRFQWSARRWRNWQWQVQKKMDPLKLSFLENHHHYQMMMWRSVLHNLKEDQTSFMLQGKTGYPLFWRTKLRTCTPSQSLLLSSHHAQNTPIVRLSTNLLLPKPSISLFLHSGVLHLLAIISLSSPSLEFLN